MKKIKVESHLIIEGNQVDNFKEELKDLLNKYSYLQKETRCSTLTVLIDSSIEINGFKCGKMFKVNDEYLLIVKVNKNDNTIKGIFLDNKDLSIYLYPWTTLPMIESLDIKEDKLIRHFHRTQYGEKLDIAKYYMYPRLTKELDPVYIKEISEDELSVILTKVPAESYLHSFFNIF